MPKTNAGVDYISAQVGAAAYVALSANSATPVASSTTLAGEITTAGGGLVRKLATYAHTAGTAVYTLTATFTANGSDVLPVTVAKAGVFSAASAGVMVWESLISPTAPFAASGDQATITHTVTIS